MMHHVAIWTANLEEMKSFYVKYFGGVANDIYQNQKSGFKSYFLTFEGSTMLELMQMPTINESINRVDKQLLGFAHLAFSVGSKEKVDRLTTQLVNDGFSLASEPRTTGDGYYESCIFDPELNRIEITI